MEKLNMKKNKLHAAIDADLNVLFPSVLEQLKQIAIKKSNPSLHNLVKEFEEYESLDILI